MSLLSGLKFVRKDGATAAHGEHSHSTSAFSAGGDGLSAMPAASSILHSSVGRSLSGAQSASASRMGWMTDATGFSFVGRPKAEAPVDPEVARLRSESEASARLIQAEILAGLREPSTGALYGLYDPKKDKGRAGAAAAAPIPVPVPPPHIRPAWKRAFQDREQGGIAPATSNTAGGATLSAPPATANTPVLHEPHVGAAGGATPSPPPAAGAPAPAADLNKLHAALLRASMVGDSARMASIQAQIGVAQMHGEFKDGMGLWGSRKRDREEEREGEEGGRPDKVKVVVSVSGLDGRGMPIPSLTGDAVLAREDMRLGRRKGKVTSSANAVGSDGARTALAYGDQSVEARELSIVDMARQEKRVGSGDLDANIVRNMVRGGGRYASALTSDGQGRDEEDAGALDDAGRLVAGAEARYTAVEARGKDLARAVQAQGRGEEVVSRCALCLASAEVQARHAHSVLVQGEYSYVSLPPDGARVQGHVVIAPREHCSALTMVGEEVYEEINRFKAALCAMYGARPEPEDAVFLETALHLSSAGGDVSGATGLGGSLGKRRHARVDVIPMDADLAFDAPLFFRKAIQDAEEWTTNPSLIDTAGKGLRRAVPPGFSYFHVAWRGGGLVHPVEEDDSFPREFGMDIACGMLGEGPSRLGRKSRGRHTGERGVEETLGEVRAFKREWAPFDFTKSQGSGATIEQT